MYGAWDAPLEFQQLLLDEGDPPPVESSATPDYVVKSSDDPDTAFGYASAYAAQIMVLDACWENVFDGLHASAGDEWLVMLIGARGFPLGEHGRIGGIDRRMYADQLHVPWLIRFPNNLGQLVRSNHLASHADVLPTFIDWLDGDPRPGEPAFDGMSVLPIASAARTAWQDAVISTSATARTIRTADWCLREDISSSDGAIIGQRATSPSPELFVRPDDRWEANDVAKLCADACEELRTTISATLRRLSQGEPMPTNILPSQATVPTP